MLFLVILQFHLLYCIKNGFIVKIIHLFLTYDLVGNNKIVYQFTQLIGIVFKFLMIPIN